jgi:uncharacterized protein
MVRRLAIVLVITALVVLGAALPAWAHVSVSPSTATAGGFTTLVFQVPNEESDATTTKVEVHFPEGEDQAIADASVQAVNGWTVKVNKAKLTTPITTDEGDSLDEKVSSIVWTADGDGIGDGEFQQFLVSVGLPDTEGTLLFPATQTYSNGTTVDWNEQATGSEEPEHPAPSVTLTAGSDEGSTPTTAASGDGAKASAASNASGAVKDAQDDADSAKTLGIIALIVGVLALIVGIVAVAASRRRTTV